MTAQLHESNMNGGFRGARTIDYWPSSSFCLESMQLQSLAETFVPPFSTILLSSCWLLRILMIHQTWKQMGKNQYQLIQFHNNPLFFLLNLCYYFMAWNKRFWIGLVQELGTLIQYFDFARSSHLPSRLIEDDPCAMRRQPNQSKRRPLIPSHPLR